MFVREFRDCHLIKGQLFEAYKVMDEGCTGTTSLVYRVRREGKDYALKLYTQSLTSDYKERFIREAKYLCQFSHPNIVKGIEYGFVQNTKRPFLIMEYVEGCNLKEFGSWCVRTKGQFPVELAIGFVRQIVLALDYVVKSFNILHRDLKLENIMVVQESFLCKIIDFGLAKKIGEKIKLPSSWEQNAAPRYRAPEKWGDFHASEEKSDVWSLGVILYYLLTGEFPFYTSHDTGTEKLLMDMVLHNDPPPPSHKNALLPSYIDTLIAFMLSKNAIVRPNFSELILILSGEKPALPDFIERAYRARAEDLRRCRFDPEEDQRSRSVDYIGRLYTEEYRQSAVVAFKRTRKRAFERFLEAQVKWGPSLSSLQPKVANVCEVLITADNHIIESTRSVDILTEVISWLIDQKQGDGFPSLSYKLVTTTCTALAAMALYHISNISSLPYDVRNKALEISMSACQACIGLADERGWGTWSKSRIRIQPTIWALRAIACHYKDFEVELISRLRQLRAMHSIGRPGCFGFKPGTDPQISLTAGFLLLLSELELSGYQPDDKERYYLERYNAIKFLITDARQNAIFWPSVQELYYVDDNIVPLVSGIEQMSWFHISGPVSVEALARNSAFIGLTEDTIVWFRSVIELYRKFLSTGLLQDPVLLEAGLKDPIFPTAYGCMALQAAELWLESFDDLAKIPPSPPKPEIIDGIIHKSGAAIIRDNKLLLVRKFGTDQMILPGGGIYEEESPIETLRRELREELGTDVRLLDNEPIGVYRATAAFERDVEVEIILFLAELPDDPKPLEEIEELVWYVPGDESVRLSPILRDLILPSLIAKDLLKLSHIKPS